ncbi:MAG: hypothetical protein EPO08_16270 [Rhodospirillaceae bacterium]|nr:MAG: hypothetical protein EPO08_16270 [Rhodospirillaceae bacterium]
MRALTSLYLPLVLASLLAGCVATPPNNVSTQEAYRAAISDAAVASPGKVAPLRVLPAGATITMVSWVTEQRLPCTNDALPCDMKVGATPLWVTLGGEVQSICRTWNLHGDALRRRLEQLLGLPMDPPVQYRKTKFVDLEIPRERIERPCLGVDETDPTKPVCTIDARSSTSAELRTFIGEQMAASYVVDNPKGPGYPYTRLGYTYDWAPTANAKHYGASEFIVAPATTAKATKVVAADDYCRAP